MTIGCSQEGKIERREERKRERGRVEGGREEGCKNVAKRFG